ncbi:hypothetical protein BDN72DRAFT_782381 [Pluteus cervinus]|uniref:Uncharacterized protein n=1 Tax=Pluteus cervinus TaxID=181527 RepID=A0ACD2ZYM4_9AGAR|nr:hypothetical protein BDN72DRAFT_782381 [Pluteus cervinus]
MKQLFLFEETLVHWFILVEDNTSPNTRMWVVEPLRNSAGNQVCSLEHVDSIAQVAHLIGVYGNHPLPHDFTFHQTLHTFNKFYVNKFIDYHMHEIAF